MALMCFMSFMPSRCWGALSCDGGFCAMAVVAAPSISAARKRAAGTIERFWVFIRVYPELCRAGDVSAGGVQSPSGHLPCRTWYHARHALLSPATRLRLLRERGPSAE